MKIVTLEKVAKFINGYAFKPSDWANNGLKIIRIQNLTNSKKPYNKTNKNFDPKYLIKNGDILVSWSATLDVFEWQDEDALLNQHIFKVEHDENVINKYYFKYVLKDTIEDMKKFAHGSTMKHVVKKDFINHKIPLPSLEEQKRIVEKLDEADLLRQKRTQSVASLDDYLKAVFLEMFGDPHNNIHGFPIGFIGDLVSEVKYGTSNKAQSKGGYPYLRMNNITYSGEMDFSDLKYINLTDVEKPKYLTQRGDILFNRTNSKALVGKTAVYDSDKPMAIAGYLIRVRSNEKAIPEYISGYLNSKHGKLTLENMCKNIVGMANINAKELQKIRINLPPVDLQRRYTDVVRKIRELKARMIDQSKELDINFNALMQGAFLE